jgi:anthranilate phosphoribosyltransferase
MVIGVYDKKLCRLIADASLRMGKKHILVVHGEDGMDEISTAAPTHVCELKNGTIKEYRLNPEDYGIKLACPLTLQGGTPADNAHLIRSVFEGTEQGAPRDIVALNAAAGILVSGRSKNWNDAVKLAFDTIASGKASDKLKMLVKVSND